MLHIWKNINQFIGNLIFPNVAHKSARVSSKATQITSSQASEVHPYCANDANKANDPKKTRSILLSCQP